MEAKFMRPTYKQGAGSSKASPSPNGWRYQTVGLKLPDTMN